MQLQEILSQVTIKRRNKIIETIDSLESELTIHEIMSQEFAEFMQNNIFKRLDAKTQDLLMLVAIMQAQ